MDIKSNDQEYYHPYAHQPTPFEKLQEFFRDAGENTWFFVYEVIGWTLDKVWGLIVNVILLPIALLGLLLDFLRQKVTRVSIFHKIAALTCLRLYILFCSVHEEPEFGKIEIEI